MTVFDLYDMHCHLAFSPDTRASAIALRQEGIGGMCATVTPDEYHLASLALADELNRNSNFKLGVGLHPWWLSDGSCGADAVDKLVAYALYWRNRSRFCAPSCRERSTAAHGVRAHRRGGEGQSALGACREKRRRGA